MKWSFLFLFFLCSFLSYGQSISDNTLSNSVKSTAKGATSSAASSTSNDDILTAAHLAFEQKNYADALSLYQQSYLLQPSNNTQYNIAVCHFKLTQWQQAYVLFEQLEQSDNTDYLYSYNKALALKKMGKTDDALTVFEEVELLSDDETLVLLATKQLLLLEKTSNQPLSPKSENNSTGEWFGNIGVNLGNDDNVTLPDEEFITGVSDTFIESIASLSYLTNNSSTSPWLINATFYNTQYDEATDFDARFLSIGSDKTFRLNKLSNISVSADYDDLNLAGEDYLSTLRFKTKYGYRVSNDAKIQLSWQYKSTSADDERYYFLAGNSHNYAIKWLAHSGDNFWTLAGKYNFEDKADLNTGDQFISFSAHRLGVYYAYHWRLNAANLSFNSHYRYSHYLDANWDYDEESAEVTFMQTREDTRFSLALDADYEFNKHWLATGHLEYTNNNSNISHYDYKQSVITLGIAYQF